MCRGGLKRLPEVGGITYSRRHSYMQLVSSFLQVLDSTLPTAHITGRCVSAVSEPSPSSLPASSRTHTGYLPKAWGLRLFWCLRASCCRK